MFTQMDLNAGSEFKYIRLDVLDYAAVVEFDDFKNHYFEVCAEFSRARCDYLYTHKVGKHKLIHLSFVSYASAILLAGIQTGSMFCDVGSCVYAYDQKTPVHDVVGFKPDNDERRIGFLFEWEGDMYQCVHSKDTWGPLRYCVVRERIPAENIIECSLDADSLLEPVKALDFLKDMGYPEAVLEHYKCGKVEWSIADDCAVLNGNRDRDGVEALDFANPTA